MLLDGEDVLAMSFGELRAVRWAEAALVFQGAMHALNPVQRIGDQIAEPILLHDEGQPEGARTTAGRRAARAGRPARRPARAATRTSSPAARSSAS